MVIWATRWLLWATLMLPGALRDSDSYTLLLWRLLWTAPALIVGLALLRRSDMLVHMAYPNAGAAKVDCPTGRA